MNFLLLKEQKTNLAIDIKTLRGVLQEVVTTIDPGYKNTGACESAITFLNGEEGILTLPRIFNRRFS